MAGPVNVSVDRLARMIQELYDRVDRAPKLIDDNGNSITDAPISAIPNTLLAVDSQGNLILVDEGGAHPVISDHVAQEAAARQAADRLLSQQITAASGRINANKSLIDINTSGLAAEVSARQSVDQSQEAKIATNKLRADGSVVYSAVEIDTDLRALVVEDHNGNRTSIPLLDLTVKKDGNRIGTANEISTLNFTGDATVTVIGGEATIDITGGGGTTDLDVLETTKQIYASGQGGLSFPSSNTWYDTGIKLPRIVPDAILKLSVTNFGEHDFMLASLGSRNPSVASAVLPSANREEAAISVTLGGATFYLGRAAAGNILIATSDGGPKTCLLYTSPSPRD